MRVSYLTVVRDSKTVANTGKRKILRTDFEFYVQESCVYQFYLLFFLFSFFFL